MDNLQKGKKMNISEFVRQELKATDSVKPQFIETTEVDFV